MIKNQIEQIEKKYKKVSTMIKNYKKLSPENSIALQRFISTNYDLLTGEIPDLNSISEELNLKIKEELLLFESELIRKADEEGLRVYGNWPRYYINEFIPVVIEEKTLTLKISDQLIDNFDPVDIIWKCKEIISDFKSDEDSARKFLEALYNIYNTIKKADESISIWDIYKQMILIRQEKSFWKDANISRFKPFTILEFTFYMNSILRQNLNCISNHHLRLLPPVSGDSLFIYQPAEKRFSNVGRLQFIKNAEKT